MTKYTCPTIFCLLKIRGSKKKAIQSGRQWYLWRKGTFFPNVPTKTLLGSVFSLPWSCYLNSLKLVYTTLNAQSSLKYCKSPLNLKHILVPSIKHIKLPPLPRQKWPTSSKACLNTWKIAGCLKNLSFFKFLRVMADENHSFFPLWTGLFFFKVLNVSVLVRSRIVWVFLVLLFFLDGWAGRREIVSRFCLAFPRRKKTFLKSC